jgi:hypothetical protein
MLHGRGPLTRNEIPAGRQVDRKRGEREWLAIGTAWRLVDRNQAGEPGHELMLQRQREDGLVGVLRARLPHGARDFGIADLALCPEFRKTFALGRFRQRQCHAPGPVADASLDLDRADMGEGAAAELRGARHQIGVRGRADPDHEHPRAAAHRRDGFEQLLFVADRAVGQEHDLTDVIRALCGVHAGVGCRPGLEPGPITTGPDCFCGMSTSRANDRFRGMGPGARPGRQRCLWRETSPPSRR